MTIINSLLFVTINWIATVDASPASREAARVFVNQQVTYTRTRCHLRFVDNCLRYRVFPNFVRRIISIPEGLPTTNAIARKKESLQLELLRVFKEQLTHKEKQTEQGRGFSYLHVTRTWKKEDIKELLKKMKVTMTKEQGIIYERHAKKWKSLTSGTYPDDAEDYFVDLVNSRPSFPFVHADDFLFSVRAPSSNDTGDSEFGFRISLNLVSNETELALSPIVQTCLSKGPNYRAPPNLQNNEFYTNVEKQLDRLKYNLRWKDKINEDMADDK